jgi:hypothetical protein
MQTCSKHLFFLFALLASLGLIPAAGRAQTAASSGSMPSAVATAAAPAVPTATGTTGAKTAPTTRPDVQWVRYADPVEHAFTIDVPAGWHVAGGTRRVSAIDIRLGVNVKSPDGTISLFYGNPNVPPFAVPSPMLAKMGLREGMDYNIGQGVQLRIMPYLTGEEFARVWGERRLSRDLTDVTHKGARARPDSSQAITKAYSQGGIKTTIHAGEARFTGTLKGEPAIGYVFAATELVQSETTMWDMKLFAGFSAQKPEAAGAAGVLTHMVASFAIDRDWQARQQALAQQFDRIVAQSDAAVSRAIAENGKMLAAASDRQFQAGMQRADATFNANEQYDAYAVRGTSDFVNPSTGSTYGSLDNSYAHTYVRPDQQILQTDSENPPGANWEEIHPVPPGQ